MLVQIGPAPFIGESNEQAPTRAPRGRWYIEE